MMAEGILIMLGSAFACLSMGLSFRDWKKGNAFWAGWYFIGSLMIAAFLICTIVKS